VLRVYVVKIFFFFVIPSLSCIFQLFFLSLFGKLDFFSSFPARFSLFRVAETQTNAATTEDIYIYIKREELREHLRSKRERVKSKRTRTRREKSVT